MRRRLVAFVTAGIVAATPLVSSGFTSANSVAPLNTGSSTTGCDCDEEGDYVSPRGLTQPFITGTGESKSSDAKYRVSASGAGDYRTVVVYRTSDDKRLASIYTSATQWGFSPDEDRFVLHGHGITSEYLDGALYDLTGSSPGTPIKSFNMRTSDARVGFSPRGKYFALVYLQAVDNQRVGLELYSAYTGQLRHSTDFKPYTGTTGSDYGAAGFGFSPDDNAFFYAWATSASQVARRLYNLSTKKLVLSGDMTATGFWQFSPCGSRFAIVEQNNPTTAQVRLYRTDDVAAALATKTVPVGAITFAATAASHTVTSSDGTEVLAPNTDDCTSAPPEWDAGTKTGGKRISNDGARITWGMVAWSSAPTSGYRVRVGGGAFAYVPATQHRYVDVGGLDPGTRYSVEVVAVDEDGNESAPLTGEFLTSTIVPISSNEIGGRMFRDTNGNGVPDGGEQGVNLTTHLAPAIRAYLRDDDRVVRDTFFAETDTLGNFRFRNLPDGDYVIATTGGVPLGTPATQSFPADFQPYELTIVDGQGFENVNFGMAYANYPAVGTGSVGLAGSAFDDANADGLRDAGEGPAGGVRVSCYEVHRGAQCGNSDDTGAGGGYHFENAQPGTHLLSAYHPDDGKMSTSLQAIHVMGVGEAASGIDFGIHEATASVSVTLFNDVDGDGERSPDESPIDGVEARACLDREGQPYWSSCEWGSHGEIEIANVPVGTFELVASLGDAGWESPAVPVTVTSPGQTLSIEVPVELDLVFGSVTGVVWDDANSDGVRDTDEEGIGGVEICAWREGDESSRCTHSAEGTGRYDFAGMTPGAWEIGTWDSPGGKVLTYPHGSSFHSIELDAGEQRRADFGFGIDAHQPEVPVPSDLSATPGDGRVALAWTIPAGDEVEIHGFDVQRQAAGGTWEDVVGQHPEAFYDDDSVTNGISYAWRVRSVSDSGNSEWSEPVSATPQAEQPEPVVTAPSAPRSVTTRPGTRSTTVTWSVPASTGGATITDYVVQYSTSPTGGWVTADDGVGSSPAATIRGLRDGATYYVRVAALNQAGTGTWSAIAAVTTHATPSKPRKVKLRGKTKALVVRWKSPAATGGTTVTGYVIQYSTKRASGWKTVTTGSSTKTTIKKLKKRKRYFVRVAAVNAAGQSAWSKVQKVRLR